MAAICERFKKKKSLLHPRLLGELVKNKNSQVQLYLREEFQLVTAERMRGTDSYHKANSTVISVASEIHSWILKLMGESLKKNSCHLQQICRKATHPPFAFYMPSSFLPLPN